MKIEIDHDELREVLSGLVAPQVSKLRGDIEHLRIEIYNLETENHKLRNELANQKTPVTANDEGQVPGFGKDDPVLYGLKPQTKESAK